MARSRFKLQILITLFVFRFGLQAQENVSGFVLDKDCRQQLVAVNVMLLRADSSILTFACSDEQGKFQLPLHSEAAFLRLSCLGYTSLQLKSEGLTDGGTYYLTPRTYKVPEVKVTSGRIRTVNDTITYRVSGFKMIQDRSIGDVLRKMPGIEVSSTGAIKFEGKPINRFYVEGLNLLDDQYQLGSRNIPADAVSEVEILRNHQPIRSLQGKEFSDQAAMNIKLTAAAKKHWLFNLDLGFGFKPFLWKNRVMGMRFGGKSQTLALYKNDNTGEDISSEINQTMLTDIASVEMQPVADIFPNTIATESNQACNFNESHLAAINHLRQFSRDRSLRTRINYLNSKTTDDTYTETNWFIPNAEKLMIIESDHSKFNRNELRSNFAYEQNDHNIYLKNSLSIGGNWNELYDEILQNNRSIGQQYTLNRLSGYNDFHLIRKIGNRVWAFKNNTKLEYLPQKLYVTMANDTLTRDYQQAILHNFTNTLTTSYSHSIRGFFISYNLGWAIGRDNFDSELSGNFNVPILPIDSLSNQFAFNRSDLSIQPVLNYQNGGLRLVLSAKTTWLHTNIENKTVTKDTQRDNFLLFEPVGRLVYALSESWDMTLIFNRISTGTNLYALIPNYILKDYRTINANESLFRLNHNNITSFSIGYANPLQALFWKNSISIDCNKSTQLTSDFFDGIVMTSSVVDSPSRRTNLTVSSRFSKGFSFMNSRLYLNGMYSKRQQLSYMEEIFSQTNQHFYRAQLELYTQPFRWMNIESMFRIKWSQLNRVKPTQEEINRLNNYTFKLDVTFNLSRKWLLRFRNNYSKESSFNQKLFLSDAELKYMFLNQEIGLLGSNLFNHQHYYRTYESNLKEVSRIMRIRPRQFLIRYSFAIK